MNNFFELGPVIEGYLSYLKELRHLSIGTLKDMRCTFKNSLIAMIQIRPGRDLWEHSLDDFIRWIECERKTGKSVLSIAKQISHLRGLIDYAWRSGKIDRNVLDGFRLKDAETKSKIPPMVLSIDDTKKLIASCERTTPRQKRIRLMILILYGCGLRSGELCKLDIQDIDKDRQELFIKTAKGDLQRRVPVPDGVWVELLAYVLETKRNRGALFKTETKKVRVNPKDVQSAVYLAALSAGLGPDVLPKTLRHTYATHLMEVGVDLGVIASLMGHKSPQETGVYLHALSGKKEAAVDKLLITTEVKKEEEIQ